MHSRHAPLKLGARALGEVGDGIKPVDVQGRKLLVGVARALDEHEGYSRHGGGVSVGEGGRVGRVSWWGRVAAATRELGAREKEQRRDSLFGWSGNVGGNVMPCWVARPWKDCAADGLSSAPVRVLPVGLRVY